MDMNIHIRLEGNPAEVIEVLRSLPEVTNLRATAVELTDDMASSETASESAESDSTVVTTRFARLALTRLGLSSPMKNALIALCEAHPGWLTRAELHDVTGYKPAQFAGLLGAFGRRLTKTKGYDENLKFFEYRWNDDQRAWDYRLPKTVCKALELEQLV